MLHANMCVTYSLLQEMCLVVSKNATSGSWDLVRHGKTNQLLMGCSSESYDVAHYVHQRDVKMTEVRNSISDVTIRVRSL